MNLASRLSVLVKRLLVRREPHAGRLKLACSAAHCETGPSSPRLGMPRLSSPLPYINIPLWLAPEELVGRSDPGPPLSSGFISPRYSVCGTHRVLINRHIWPFHLGATFHHISPTCSLNIFPGPRERPSYILPVATPGDGRFANYPLAENRPTQRPHRVGKAHIASTAKAPEL